MRKNKVFKELKKRENDEVCYVVPDYLRACEKISVN